MSATGRGGERVAEDFYPTPAWCTRRILEALPSLRVSRATWLEPCVGDGAISRLLNEAYGGNIIDVGDIRNVDDYNLGADTIHSGRSFEEWTGTWDAVITNPPFSLAPELIAHFIPRCDWLILLLRSSFKLGKYRDNMPDEYRLPQRPEFVASEKCKGGPDALLPRRFLEFDPGHDVATQNGCGWNQKIPMSEPATRICPQCGGKVQRSTTDASEYSWFVWTPERGRKFGRISVLPDTPLAERVEDRRHQ